MSNVELKQFKKHEYKIIVLDEMTELLPDVSQSQLDETALCVSNFQQCQIQVQLRRKPRQSTGHSTELLPETIIKDLDTTLEPAENKADADHDSSDGHASEQQGNGDTIGLGDGVTLLKHAASADPKDAESSAAVKTESKRPTNYAKCCDTCKVTPTSKQKYDQISCSNVPSGFLKLLQG